MPINRDTRNEQRALQLQAPFPQNWHRRRSRTPHGAVVLPVAASELPRLDQADPTAKALGYVHDASALGADIRVDATRVCSTCRFYPRAEQAWGTCALFPGKVVSAQGWCKAWVAGA